jgi:hypothetical protein
MKKKYRYHCKIGTKGNDGNGKNSGLSNRKTCNMGEKPCNFSKTRIGFLPEEYVVRRVYTVQYSITYTDENKRFKRANLKNKRILKARAKSYKIRGLM